MIKTALVSSETSQLMYDERQAAERLRTTKINFNSKKNI
jgi:hypothetical protein